MPVRTSAFVEPAVSKMLASCPTTWKPNNNTRELFKSFAQSYADMLDSWLRSIQAVGGIVAGGAAPPGGPVVGAMLTLSPGSAQTSAYKKVVDVFEPPKFSITLPTGEIRNGAFTPWLRGAVHTVSTEVDTQLKAWLAGWAAAGLSVVVGGTAAWVASTPPAPGPWTAGTVVPFLFSGPSGGMSAAQALVDNVKTTLDARARATFVGIEVDMNGGISTTTLINDQGDSGPMFKCFAAGFNMIFDSILKMAMLKDASGAGGQGVAAPGGIITGTMGPLVVDV